MKKKPVISEEILEQDQKPINPRLRKFVFPKTNTVIMAESMKEAMELYKQ